MAISVKFKFPILNILLTDKLKIHNKTSIKFLKPFVSKISKTYFIKIKFFFFVILGCEIQKNSSTL